MLQQFLGDGDRARAAAVHEHPRGQARRHRPRADGADAAAGGQLRHADHHRRRGRSRSAAPAVRRCARSKATSTKRTRSSLPPARGRITWACRRKRHSRIAASAPAPCATARCRGSATSRSSSSAAATRPSKRPRILTKYASKVHMVHRRDKLRASMIMQERALGESEDPNGVEPHARRSAGQRQGRRHRRAARQHQRRQRIASCPPAACSWRSATRRTRTC